MHIFIFPMINRGRLERAISIYTYLKAGIGCNPMQPSMLTLNPPSPGDHYDSPRAQLLWVKINHHDKKCYTKSTIDLLRIELENTDNSKDAY